MRVARERQFLLDRPAVGIVDRVAQRRGIARVELCAAPEEVRRDAALGVDEHMAAQARQLAHLVRRLDQEALQRERRFGPRPVEAADVHAGREVAHVDLLLLDLCRDELHAKPITERGRS